MKVNNIYELQVGMKVRLPKEDGGFEDGVVTRVVTTVVPEWAQIYLTPKVDTFISYDDLEDLEILSTPPTSPHQKLV